MRSGFVTDDEASNSYGVVLENGGYSEPATTARRHDMSTARKTNFFDFGPERDEFESIWTDENYATLSDLLSGLPVHWRFFMKHRLFEAVGDDPNGGSIRERFEKIVAEYPELSRSL